LFPNFLAAGQIDFWDIGDKLRIPRVMADTGGIALLGFSLYVSFSLLWSVEAVGGKWFLP